MVDPVTATRKRSYASPLRDAQTAQTRRRIVEAAREELVRRGYAATSVNAIAAAAGVSRETVYHLVGGKPAIVKAVYDVAVVGDHEEVPVAERSVYQAMLADPDPDSAARTYGRLTAELVGRIGPVLRVLADASHELELADLLEATRRERLVGTRQLLSTLSGRTEDDERLDRATDVVWALISPELALLLVDQRGWTLAAYGDWLGEQVIDQLHRLSSGP